PRNLSVLWSLFESYLALHEYTKADGTVNDALSLSPSADFFVLARSAIALFRDGDIAPLRSALRKIPRSFDPGGATSTIGLRLSLMERDVEEADRVLAAATRAGELLPIAKDSFDGPILATTLAAVSAKLGEKDLAIRQLESLVGVPNGPTPGTLRVEPEWDSLRDDPRFKKLAEAR